MNNTKVETVYAGRFLKVAKRGTWEYVTRPNATGIVVIVPVHDDGRVVLVEQYRPPVDRIVIEFPAGLAGDINESESLLTAAQRELEEETGYVAKEWTQLETACSSPGLTDEACTFFLAQDLQRTGEGGGDDTESLIIHEVPMQQLSRWIKGAIEQDKLADMKLLAGLYAATAHINEKDT